MSTTYSGQLPDLLAALETESTHPLPESLTTILGADCADDQIADSIYRSFHSQGVSVLYRDDFDEVFVCSSVFVYLQPVPGDEDSDPFTAYPAPERLFDGFDAGTATREQRREFFGGALRSEPGWDIYGINGRYMNVGFDGDRAAMITAMVRVPGGISD